MSGAIHVVAMPRLDAARDRIRARVAPGATLREIIAQVLPGGAVAPAWLQVWIGEHRIDPCRWHRVRPRDGAQVLIQVVPEGDNLRTVLSLVVTVAAIAVGQFYLAPLIAGSLGIAAGTLGYTAITAATVLGLTVAGNLLLNALVPLKPPAAAATGGDAAKVSPTLQGLQNNLTPRGVVPVVLGRHRMAPPYAAPSYTEIVGDDMYLVSAFCFGYGPLALSDFRLGDTPADDYDEVQLEYREGYAGDAPLTLYREQVLEEPLSVRLAYPVDASGAPIGDATEGKPALRVAATDAAAASIDVVFPAGLVAYDDQGNQQPLTVAVRIRYRPLGGSTWTEAATLAITAATQSTIRRSHRWTLPARGQYEVEVTRMTPERLAVQGRTSDTCDWSCLRSFRPEYPIAFDRPLALAALRIKATDQLNGVIANFNAICQSVVPDWDAPTRTWITRPSASPAALYRAVLQGPATAYPRADAEIDLAGLADWHAFCAAQGLRYNAVHDAEGSVWDALADIAAAGRAAPQDLGDRWSVVVDRPQTTVIQHITPRNSWDYSEEIDYARLPDAFRVSFLSETAGYAQAERIVPRPGLVGEIGVTEEIAMPGVTDPAQIWQEARKRWYELLYRRSQTKRTMDIEAMVVRRGDLVMQSHELIGAAQTAGRVKAIAGRVVTLDTIVSMAPGRSYAVRFRRADGSTLLRSIIAAPGDTSALRLVGDPTGVAPGDLAQFGDTIRGEAIPSIVSRIETGDNWTATLTLVDAAPQITDLAATDAPPDWDGRVGDVPTDALPAPAVPAIAGLHSGGVGAGLTDITVLLAPGAGAAVASYAVDHRLVGGPTWTTVTATAAAGAALISGAGYAAGDTVEVRARAVGLAGAVSDSSAASTLRVGQDHLWLPDIAAFSATRLAAGAWRFAWTTTALADWQMPARIAGGHIRYRAGAWASWDDLADLHSGTVANSPWDSSLPADYGLYTFGLRLVAGDGGEGTAVLIYTAAWTDDAGAFVLDDTGANIMEDVSS